MTVLGADDVVGGQVNLCLFRGGADPRFGTNQHRPDQVRLGRLDRRQQRVRVHRVHHRSAQRLKSTRRLDQLAEMPAFFQQLDFGHGHALARTLSVGAITSATPLITTSPR